MNSKHIIKFKQNATKLFNMYKLKLTTKEFDKFVEYIINNNRDNYTYDDLMMNASKHSSNLQFENPKYDNISAGFRVMLLHETTSKTFSDAMNKLHKGITGKSNHLDRTFMNFINNHSDSLNSMINPQNDFLYKYFGLYTLIGRYLYYFDYNGRKEYIETPQYMLMRVAVFIELFDMNKSTQDILQSIKETYTSLSNLEYVHSSPTLFNAGKKKSQMSSCFLLTLDDSIPTIFKGLTQCAHISQLGGGIGICATPIRSTGSTIGVSGKSSGIGKLFKMFNACANYVNQGGKRNGSFAMYIEPWHGDIVEYINMKKAMGGDSRSKAIDLFYALYIPNLFMKRAFNKQQWTLFSPKDVPDLVDLHSDLFEKKYVEYENDKTIDKKTINAFDLLKQIITAQLETGTPYMIYKDAVNFKNNQKNLGTIRMSNLCAEITEYCDLNEVAVCNLASVNLKKCVEKSSFNFKKLMDITMLAVKNLNKVIDQNFYPIPEAKTSNTKHRPIGVGIQGLADVFCLLKYPFDSKEAMELNKEIFETMYYAALIESNKLAIKYGPYKTFHGSPASKGLLQFHLHNQYVDQQKSGTKIYLSKKLNHDWDGLIKSIKKYGLRNSLLLALMPTASCSQILGNNECFEPFQGTIFTRRTGNSEFIIVNEYAVKWFMDNNLWTEKIRKQIIENRGSIQNINGIPKYIKNLYKTVWEISQKNIITMAADRGGFVCQSQSLNLFIDDINPSNTFIKAMNCHRYGWKMGLKTGMYYMRTRIRPTDYNIYSSLNKKNKKIKNECTDDVCLLCQ
jgi:ribonucleoside-diphosphate reductase alpha chain